MGNSRYFSAGSQEFGDAGVAANTAHATPMTVACVVKVDALLASDQVLMARITSNEVNGWEFRISATTGALSFRSNENDTSLGTATTAVNPGTWLGVAAVLTGSGGSANVHYIRHTLATGATITEEDGMYFDATPVGTHKLTIGGRWVGFLQFPYGGLMTRAGVWAGVALTDMELKAWFCHEDVRAGADGVWVLHGSTSPEPDSSGNAYNLTLTGTTAGADPDVCPSLLVPARRMVSVIYSQG